MNDIADIYDGTHQTPNYQNQGIKFLSVENIKTLDSKKYISEEDFIKDFKTYPEYGDVLMTRIGSVGVTNIINTNEFFAYYVSLALIKPYHSNGLFLKFLIASLSVQKEIWSKTLHIAFPKKINKNEIGKLNVSLPNLDEQKKLAELLESVESNITLHQRKLNLLVSIKDAIIERVLPKDSSLYPTLRFNTFEMEWEKSKLGELVSIKTGKLDANEMVENGKYDFYTSGIQKYKINQYAFEGPAITIAGNGATVGHMHYADGFFNAYQRTYVLSDFSANRGFLFQAISVSLPSKIRREARTGNIPYIVLDMLASLDLKLPSINEQEKIGYLLEQVKKIIDLHADKSQVLDNIKKLYLHKMFL